MTQSNILHGTATNELEIIEFYIDESMPDGSPYRGYYGMNVAKVLEIIRRQKTTSMPNNNHEAVLGTFNLRGRVLPLVDLAVCLNKPAEFSEASKVIVSEYFGVVTAYLVSGVTRIHRLIWSQIEAPSAHLQSYSGHSITGVVRIENRLLFVLDMETIITSLDPQLGMNTMSEATQQLCANDVDMSDASNFHILIVDDSLSTRAAISETLKAVGFNVTCAQSGREAWDTLNMWKSEANDVKEAFFEKVQLVISDIEMPEMDGHTLTKHIKQDPFMGTLPVILFSSLVTEALRSRGDAVGADAQISKPNLPVLTKLVRTMIREKLGR